MYTPESDEHLKEVIEAELTDLLNLTQEKIEVLPQTLVVYFKDLEVDTRFQVENDSSPRDKRSLSIMKKENEVILTAVTMTSEMKPFIKKYHFDLNGKFMFKEDLDNKRNWNISEASPEIGVHSGKQS